MWPVCIHYVPDVQCSLCPQFQQQLPPEPRILQHPWGQHRVVEDVHGQGVQLDPIPQFYGLLLPLPLQVPEAGEDAAHRPHHYRHCQAGRSQDLQGHLLTGIDPGIAEAKHGDEDADDKEGDGEEEHAAAHGLQCSPSLRHGDDSVVRVTVSTGQGRSARGGHGAVS